MVYYGRLFVFTLSFEFLGKVSLNLNEFEVNCADYAKNAGIANLFCLS